MKVCSRRAPTGIRNRALIAVCWRCGLRIGEALALAPKDFDVDSGTLVVQRGKGGKRRVVGVDAGTVALVGRWLEARRERGISSGSPLFCSLAGRPMDQFSRRRHAGNVRRVPYSSADTRHDSLRGPVARTTKESAPNQSGTVLRSSIDPSPSVRRFPRKAMRRSCRRITAHFDPRWRVSTSSSTLMTSSPERRRNFTSLEREQAPVRRTSSGPSSALAASGSASAAQSAARARRMLLEAGDVTPPIVPATRDLRNQTSVLGLGPSLALTLGP